MTHQRVEADGLFTRYTDALTVTVHATVDESTDLQLEFPSEEHRHGAAMRYRRTRLTFKDVFEYRWIKTNQVYYSTNPTDHAFALIEITDSGLIQQLTDHSMYRSLPAGERLGGVVKESELRHFRIGFDHHGAYEVVCLGLQIDYVDAIA